LLGALPGTELFAGSLFAEGDVIADVSEVNPNPAGFVRFWRIVR